MERSSDGEIFEDTVSAVSAALAAECLRTTVKNAEERLSYSPCRAFEDTGKKVEKAG
ncbi:hypothetical protein KI387_016860, partial [Taxus chinensis]